MKFTARETALFGMFGAVIYVLKKVMEIVPNVHIAGVLIAALTIVYGKKALYSIYTFAFLEGITTGFSAWWIPSLYVWTVLWGLVMAVPKNIPGRVKPIVYMSICALHGLLFGTLYAPVMAVMLGMNLKETAAWVMTGLPWDIVHGISNFFCGMLVMPVVSLLRRMENY